MVIYLQTRNDRKLKKSMKTHIVNALLIVALNLCTETLNSQSSDGMVIIDGVLYPNGFPGQSPGVGATPPAATNAPPVVPPTVRPGEMVIIDGVLYPNGFPGQSPGVGATPPAATNTPPVTDAAGQFLRTASSSVPFRGSILVEWAVAPSLFSAADRIVMVDASAPDEALETKFTLVRGGETTFLASDPGSLQFYYVRGFGERLLVSNPVTVAPFIPDLSRVRNFPNGGQTIVVCCDSIALGVGADAGYDLASLLRSRLRSYEVINAGVAGDTTRSALARLERDVLSKNPQLVILTISNDERPLPGQLQPRISRSESLANFREIITRIHNAGASVLLLGVLDENPELAALYEGLTAQSRVAYFPRVMQDFWFDSRWMSPDFAHPNTSGYKRIVKRIAPAVDSMFISRAVRIEPGINEVVLTWRAVPGRMYHIVASPDPARPLFLWTTVVRIRADDATGLTAKVPQSAMFQFFRVLEEPVAPVPVISQ